MWEEEPEYQRAQARIIGLLVVGLLVGIAAYSLFQHDWALLQVVLMAAVGLGVALFLVPVVLRLVLKVLGRLWAAWSKRRSNDDA